MNKKPTNNYTSRLKVSPHANHVISLRISGEESDCCTVVCSTRGYLASHHNVPRCAAKRYTWFMGSSLTGKSEKIGTLNEKPLHAALKEWYARTDDRFEVPFDGFVIDIVRGDLLVEIQSRNFSAIKRKMRTLTDSYPVRLVYPIASEKWIVKLARDGKGIESRRKSPKRGKAEDIFQELVSFPELLSKPLFSLEVLLIQEEEVRSYDGSRGWRRKGWVINERRLLDVVDRQLFETPVDLAALLPPRLKEPFSTSDLAKAAGIPRRLAQRMAYCLREMEAITMVGKRGNAILYIRAPAGSG